MLQHRVLLLVLSYLISLAMLVLLQAAPLEERVLPKQQQLLQSFPATQQQRENAM
jgi:ABC-type anion transport system duplicated permease subunit